MKQKKLAKAYDPEVVRPRQDDYHINGFPAK